MLGFQKTCLFIFGKIRRAWLIAFRKKTVIKKLELRRGTCDRTGACCKILFRCPAYDDSKGQPWCLIYDDRPGVCGLFPLDEADLRERNLVMPGTKCGYHFVKEPQPVVSEVRWGPPPGSKKVGTFQILKAFFKKPKGREEDAHHPSRSPDPNRA